MKENQPPWEVWDGSCSKAKVRKPSPSTPGSVFVTQPSLSELSVFSDNKCECLENALGIHFLHIFWSFLYLSLWSWSPVPDWSKLLLLKPPLNQQPLGCRWEAGLPPMYQHQCFKAKLWRISRIKCISQETNLCPSLVDGLSWWVRLSSGSLSGSNRGLSGGRNLSCGGPGFAAASGKGGCRVRPGCSKRVMRRQLLIIQSILPSPNWTVLGKSGPGKLSSREIGFSGKLGPTHLSYILWTFGQSLGEGGWWSPLCPE